MLAFLTEYGMFLAKTITIVVAILLVISGILMAFRRGRGPSKAQLNVVRLNERFQEMRKALEFEMLPPHARKSFIKAEKKRRKAEKKNSDTSASDEETAKRYFVLDFKGDLMASKVDTLRKEISAVLTIARPEDELVLKLESAGGVVHAYGLAASQLARLKRGNIPLTICVDRIAASGGYMMAVVADRLIAAPFAVIGSIGVAAEFPNFHRLLRKHDIEFEQLTAGEFKRTMTVFGENSDKARKKFLQQLEDTHALFKEFVSEHRSELDLGTVSTGEYWFGKRALDLKLVDELLTSDDYLMTASETADVYAVSYKTKENLREKIMSEFETMIERIVQRVLHLRFW